MIDKVILIDKVNFYDYLSHLDDDVPVVLWWTPFGNNNLMKTCGNVKCYFTHNRVFENNIRLKV